MRGSTFLAVFLIVVGLIFVVATIRGRAPQLYEALTRVSGGGEKGARDMGSQSTTRTPRTSSNGSIGTRDTQSQVRPPRKSS